MTFSLQRSLNRLAFQGGGEEGGYNARALGHAIFTQADSWEELRANVVEATSLRFEEAAAHPGLIQLHYVKDELIPVEAA